MSAPNPIVSYDSITKPFPNTETMLDITSQAARQVIRDPGLANARVSDIANGLALLRQSQGKYPRVLHTPRDTTAALLQTHIAQKATEENKVESFILRGLESVLEFFDVRFAQSDWLGWAVSFFTWIEAIVPAGRPAAATEPEALGQNVRIAILGDFGTGLYGAPVCSQSVSQDQDGYDLLLHLGDVYYSGLDIEVTDRFLDFWPKVNGAVSRSLNGNHEMYTGGHGYFGRLLPAIGQKTSYFAMQNDRWLLVGLDTAYKQDFGGQEGVIDQDQVDWLRPIFNAAGDRKVVFFSHHQPFTLLDNNHGGNLLAMLDEFLKTGKVVAWYWGHEHRCLRYDPHPKYKFKGRCVGHAGFPEGRPDLGNAATDPKFGSQWRRLPGPADGSIPAAYVLDTPNIYIPGFENDFAPNGFMRLEIQGDRLAEYIRAPGNANIYLADL